MLQFVGLLILPVTAYQFALTKHYGEVAPEYMDDEFIYRCNQIYKICVLISVLWVALIPVFKNIFHISETWIFMMLLISLLLNTVQVPFICRLQADKNFFIAGIAQIAQGVARMTLGLLCVIVYPNVMGALLGVIISNIVFVLGNSYTSDYFALQRNHHKEFKPSRLSANLLFVALGSVGLFSLLVYSDTVLVRILLPSESAAYSSSNLLGKGMIFLTSGISFAVLPLMANRIENKTQAMLIGFGCLIVLVLAYAGFFYLTAPILQNVLFRNDTLIGDVFRTFMPFYNLMFIPYPLVYYFINYYLVKESHFYTAILLFGVLAQYALVFLFHDSIKTIAMIVGGIGYLLLLIVVAHSLGFKEKNQIEE